MLTLFGAGAVACMLLFYALGSYALEERSPWWVLAFALACAASSGYSWLAGTWPFGVVEGVWALVAFRRWLRYRAVIRDASNAPNLDMTGRVCFSGVSQNAPGCTGEIGASAC
jgi:hypothetical protein